MATLTVYAGAGDGFVRSGGNSSWDTTHHLTNGGSAFPTVSAENVNASLSGSNYNIDRLFFPFDTSSLPDDATIDSATFSFYITAHGGTNTLGIVQTSQADTTTLVTEDYDQCGSIHSATEGATRLNLASLTDAAYNVFTLNATGLGFISKTGTTKLGMRFGYDLDDSAATDSSAGLSINFSESTGTSTDPKLVISYTLATTTSTTTSSSTSSTSTTTTQSITTSTTTTTSTTRSTSTSTTTTSSSTSTTSTSTSTTSTSTTSTSSTTTMPFSIAVDSP